MCDGSIILIHFAKGGLIALSSFVEIVDLVGYSGFVVITDQKLKVAKSLYPDGGLLSRIYALCCLERTRNTDITLP